MRLPDRYNYGTLFGFSGLAGENEHADDFIGMLMPQPVTIRFDANVPVTLSVPVPDAKMRLVLSDMLEGEDLLIVFADKATVLGRSAVQPTISAEGVEPETYGDATVLSCNGFCYALYREGERFAFCRAASVPEAVASAKEKIALDIDALRDRVLAYYEAKPKCRRPEYEKLYYKCLAINRVNVYSPQNGIDCRFTTPDRLPHHHMWLWDSMFHAMAFAQYDPDMAKEAIRAVLQCQREDGFIPHMMKSKTVTSAITQPQVIAWAVLTVYRATGDKAFLSDCAGIIAKYLLWFPEHRDENHNGLLEWETDFSNVRCRCDESGMDNSPRFDTTERLDAIDASCFFVNDCRCLAEIYRILGSDAEAQRFQTLGDDTAQQINALLWDENSGGYYDRTFSGELTGMLSCCSFLPLFAGVCDQKQAAALAALLQDPEKFAPPLPVPSVACDHPDYGTDMWRGCVWLNFNYFIIAGLRRYGFDDLADSIKEKTLAAVNHWFEQTGQVFEFFDPQNETAPWYLNRKGEQPPVPDYRIRYHAITDYNWSACFTLLLIQE